MIAIGPPGVRVIEVKHWSRRWVDEHADLVDQEADRVTNKARKIGTTSRKSVRDLGRVDGVILLTRESPGVKELAGRIVRGVRFCTLKEWREAVDFEAAPVLRPQQVAQLGRLLDPKSAVALDGSLRRFGGYVNLERRTPPTERFHRVYQGVHATRHDKVILHLYDLSASDEGHAETRAKREFETLHRLQLHAWAAALTRFLAAGAWLRGRDALFHRHRPAGSFRREARIGPVLGHLGAAGLRKSGAGRVGPAA